MRPSNSSPVITRLLKAHGIVLGKTNMEELAEGLTTINPVYGPVLNPYNNLHDVGGKLQNCSCLSLLQLHPCVGVAVFEVELGAYLLPKTA